MIKVVNKRSWVKDNAEIVEVYIGRPSVLGNPYKGERSQVIAQYRTWLWNEINKKSQVLTELLRLKEIAEVADIALICWCAPKPCHGDIIKNCIEWLRTA